MAKETYEGRLACSGDGDLLADESRRVGTKTVGVFDEGGDPVLDENDEQVMVQVPIVRFGKNHGRSVAHDPDKDEFVFLSPGDDSHNDRHSKRAKEVVGTQHGDADMPGYAGTPDKPTKGMEHHFGVLEDDEHFSKGAMREDGAVTNTKLKRHSDRISPRMSSHTHQHRVGA